MFAVGPKPKSVPGTAGEPGPTIRYLLKGGNECLVKPVMIKLGNGECRLETTPEWDRKPSKQDQRDVQLAIAQTYNAQPVAPVNRKTPKAKRSTRPKKKAA